MANETIVGALVRFCDVSEIEEIYKKAFAAFQERATEVVITSASFDGGGTAGQLAGDPEALMADCEEALRRLAVGARRTSDTFYHDFSTRRVGT